MKKAIIPAIIIVSLIISITVASTVSAQGKYSIPAWVKGVAGFWAEDKITDDEFGEGLSFLIDQNIIKIPQMESLKQKVAQLEAENAILKSQVGGTAPTQSPEDCGPNQIYQNGQCVDFETSSQSPEDCGPNQVFQLGQCQDINESDSGVFTIQTERPSYNDGDIIKISGNVGTVSTSYPDRPITIIVIGPDGKTVAVAQTLPSSNGSYSHILIAGGSMQESGVYKITATYGTQKSSTIFSFESSSQSPEDCGPNQVFQLGQCQDIDESSLTVSTDQSYPYEDGDLVKITGKIVGIEGIAVSLQIINPDGNVIHSEQLSPRSDGSFSTSFVMGDSSYTEFGKYVVKVEFGSVAAETSFWYNPN